ASLHSQSPAPPRVLDIELSSDGKFVASLLETTPGDQLQMKLRATNAVQWTAPSVNCFVFGKGDTLFLISGQEFQARNIATGQVEARNRLAPSTTRVCAISPDGRYVASPLGSGKPISILEITSGKTVSTTERFSARVFSLRFSPDARWL